jgi:hypothetical protein
VTTTNNCALLLKRAVIKKVATGQKKCNKMNLEQRDVREVVFVLCTLYTHVVPGTHTLYPVLLYTLLYTSVYKVYGIYYKHL